MSASTTMTSAPEAGNMIPPTTMPCTAAPCVVMPTQNSYPYDFTPKELFVLDFLCDVIVKLGLSPDVAHAKSAIMAILDDTSFRVEEESHDNMGVYHPAKGFIGSPRGPFTIMASFANGGVWLLERKGMPMVTFDMEFCEKHECVPETGMQINVLYPLAAAMIAFPCKDLRDDSDVVRPVKDHPILDAFFTCVPDSYEVYTAVNFVSYCHKPIPNQPGKRHKGYRGFTDTIRFCKRDDGVKNCSIDKNAFYSFEDFYNLYHYGRHTTYAERVNAIFGK